MASTPEQPTFHESVLATEKSMGWPYAYALGFVHGKDDAVAGRPRDIPLTAQDDFALGYHKGYAEPVHQPPTTNQL